MAEDDAIEATVRLYPQQVNYVQRLPYVATLNGMLQDAVGRTFSSAFERNEFAAMNDTARAYGMVVAFDGAILHVVRSTRPREPLVFYGVRDNLIVSFTYQHQTATEMSNADLDDTMRQSHHDRVEAAAHQLRQLLAASPAEAHAEMLELAHGALGHDLTFEMTERIAVQWLQMAERKR